MGKLIDGVWHDVWYSTEASGGRFVRRDSHFRQTVSNAPDARFAPAAGRYHLYVSYACPWAHRTLIGRVLKGLEDVISYSAVGPDMLDKGWPFPADRPDPLHGKSHMHELYTLADPNYTGRVTVPALWDRQTDTIVCNESSEILRMMDDVFAPLGDAQAPVLYPEPLRAEIDEVNAVVYPHINNGVYKSGFATTQHAYEEAVTALFDALDAMEARLEGQQWLVGGQLTEADIRLFTTLVRFDPVYHGHFKCNVRRLRDYPNLWALTRRVYALPKVAETVRLDEIKRHYYYSHASINPHRIVPIGPQINYA